MESILIKLLLPLIIAIYLIAVPESESLIHAVKPNLENIEKIRQETLSCEIHGRDLDGGCPEIFPESIPSVPEDQA